MYEVNILLKVITNTESYLYQELMRYMFSYLRDVIVMYLWLKNVLKISNV